MGLSQQGPQLLLQNQLAAAAAAAAGSSASPPAGLGRLGPQDIQQAIQQHHQQLQHQLQQLMLFQQTSGQSMSPQAQFFLQNQVS